MRTTKECLFFGFRPLVLSSPEVQAMLYAHSSMKLPEVEGAIRRAGLRHEAHLLAVSHMDHVFAADPDKPHPSVVIYTLCQPQLYAALLAADLRFAAFLPCRVSATAVADGIELHAIAPREFCHLLN